MTQQTQKPKSRLGRGLSSLISVSELPVQAEVPTAPAGTVQSPADGEPVHMSPSEIPLERIHLNPHQPRKSLNEAALTELAASIKSTGVIQPVIARPDGDGFQLIAGERRYRAAKLAGLTTIPVIVRDVDALTQAQMALIENIQREDLNPIDRADGYKTLLQQLGLTQADLAVRLGEDRSSIANFLRLLELAELVRNLVRDGKISVGHAKLIAGTPDILEQERLANLCVSQDLSVRNLERLIQGGHATPPKRAAGAASPHILDLEKSLSRQLGMRVQVRSSSRKGRGRLVIHYSSLDQFDELLGRMGVKSE